MVTPVVSSRFGKRPLLDVPAMQVSGHGSISVQSLQGPTMPVVSSSQFPTAPNPMLGPGIYNPPPGAGFSGLPGGPMQYTGLQDPRRHQSAPAAQGQQFYYGPNGETVYPAPFYNQQNLYPGVGLPQQVPVPVPVPVATRIPYPSYGPSYGPPGNFNITCDLEYGRVVHIDVRDSQGEFRGIPDFLRNELGRTYGNYPFTQVRVSLENGEFHIYASHEKRRRRRRRRGDYDSESDSEYYEDDYDDHNYRYGTLPKFRSEVESYTSGVRPMVHARPRGITHEKGWNHFR